MLDPRSTENTAAPSVAATIEPSSSPSLVSRLSSHEAARPTIAAVAAVPTMASAALGLSTGLISLQPAARPPSNRISARATTPIVRASSTSDALWPKSINPSTSEPISMPRQEEQHQARHPQAARDERGSDAEARAARRPPG